jgi:hypothetical protein
MKTFTWVFWRIALSANAAWGWGVTVYDHRGKWRKVFGRIHVLVERAK